MMDKIRDRELFSFCEPDYSHEVWLKSLMNLIDASIRRIWIDSKKNTNQPIKRLAN